MFRVFQVVFLVNFLLFPFSPPQMNDLQVSGEMDSTSEENTISVRESNTELHIAVKNSIYVFGKARGTLDKIKVGMHVLTIAQSDQVVGLENSFAKVTWKKLKSGAIQIQSFYHPWPSSLTWTVYSSGDLKMEAEGTPSSGGHPWFGLGFNLPDLQLNQVTWKGSSKEGYSKEGVWKNSAYHPMSDPELKWTLPMKGFFEPVHHSKFEFESVTMTVKSDTPGLFLGLGQPDSAIEEEPDFASDVAFLLRKNEISWPSESGTPGESVATTQAIQSTPLVLWFHFQ